MKQKQYSPQSVAEMGVVLYAANEGYLSDVEVNKIGDFEAALLSYMHAEHGDLMSRSSRAATTTTRSKRPSSLRSRTFKSTQTW